MEAGVGLTVPAFCSMAKIDNPAAFVSTGVLMAGIVCEGSADVAGSNATSSTTSPQGVAPSAEKNGCSSSSVLFRPSSLRKSGCSLLVSGGGAKD